MANPDIFSVFDTFSQLGFEWKEIFLFTVMLSVICLIIVMVQTSAIQRDVNSRSRCVRERNIGRLGTVYKVQALTNTNEPLFSISYDMNSRVRKVTPTCTKSSNTTGVMNQFNNIRMYDLMARNVVEDGSSGNIYCDKDYNNSEIHYTGHPDLLRFMQYGDTYLFDTANANR